MNTEQQVALFVDFENLVYGVREHVGANFADHIDAEALVRLAEESGEVILANAYADWRFKDINQFQGDLYRVGMDLVHVFGKHANGGRFKNAVDVKMAVDAIETLFMFPHVKVYVIVSGDRDFIHVLKTLRRHGKTVIGISPENSVSEDFAALCDRFVRYQALTGTLPRAAQAAPEAGGAGGLDRVRQALRDILAEKPNGLKGASLKPLLRRRIASTFDESEYGFTRMTDLLHALPDVVRVVLSPTGGDVTLYPAGAEVAQPAPAAPAGGPVQQLVYRANLPWYKFEPNAERRRRFLAALYEVMTRGEPFTLGEVFKQMLAEQEELSQSTTALSRHLSVFWQNRALVVMPGQEELSQRERQMSLAPGARGLENFTFRYEAGIVHKLAAAARAAGQELTAAVVVEALGLPEGEPSDEYARRLMAFSPFGEGATEALS